jgi:hypothetical protein
MRSLTFVFCLVAATSVFGQTGTRSFGSVVFPGGSSTSPGITRNFGSVVFPGGAAVPPVRGGAPVVGGVPVTGFHPGTGFTNPGFTNPGPIVQNGQNFRRNQGNRNSRNNTPYVYAYPVYIGGGYDSGYANGYQGNGYPGGYGPDPGPGPAPFAPPTQPNVTVVYPPAQHAAPVMIQAGPDGKYYTTGGEPGQGATIYDSPRSAAPVQDDQAQAADVNRYLIAFKDHTIYSAVAYWADGDTLHYFTSGNTHNQVSISLIDRPLTERLNKELGIDFKLPAAK